MLRRLKKPAIEPLRARFLCKRKSKPILDSITWRLLVYSETWRPYNIPNALIITGLAYNFYFKNEQLKKFTWIFAAKHYQQLTKITTHTIWIDVCAHHNSAVSRLLFTIGEFYIWQPCRSSKSIHSLCASVNSILQSFRLKIYFFKSTLCHPIWTIFFRLSLNWPVQLVVLCKID